MARSTIFLTCAILLLVNITSIESQKPLYYGFFFDKTVATAIKGVTDSYFNNCLANVTHFSTFLQSAANSSNVTNVGNYYTKPLDPNTLKFDPYYHITTKFCGGEVNCTTYAAKVDSSLNKTFSIDLVGYYFTSRTFGIRAKLTPEEEALFENDVKGFIQDFEFEVQEEHCAGSAVINYCNQTVSLNPTKNTPHVTVGCAPGITAEVTGSDLRQIINQEARLPISLVGNYTIGDAHGGATVIRYGNNISDTLFVIYPNMKITAKATFQAYLLPVDKSSAGMIGAATCLNVLIASSYFCRLGMFL